MANLTVSRGELSQIIRKLIILLGEAVDKRAVRPDNVPPFGGVPEWPKGSDCKSDAKASVVRIHPPPPYFPGNLVEERSGYSLVVEPQPSKLMMWVRFPLPAPMLTVQNAHIAQSVEHFLGKEEVTGSNPVMSSTPFRVGVVTDQVALGSSKKS
jgi:hypothetical protein